MLRTLFLAGLSLVTLVSYAQSPTTGGPTPIAPDPTAVPLDGGASLLLISGVAYGLRHFRQRRRFQN